MEEQAVHGAQTLLEALPVVLCVGALTSVIFQRLKQPVVFGYLIAGLIVGPHVPIPLVADAEVVHALSELGVILLMFALGLEFRFKKLLEVGPTAGIVAVIETSIMGWLGFSAGRFFGFGSLESVFLGAIVAISSTTIIAKVFAEQKVGGRLRELVLGILIVEDLIAILLMTTLTAVATGSGMSIGDLALTIAKLAAFLAVLIVGGMLVVPRFIRAVIGLKVPETTLVASVGICFAGAALAGAAGYSVALGAFIAGSLVAESGEGKRIEHLTQPVRDMFAAIFFVSVGMLIDPRLIAANWQLTLVLSVVVVVGKIIGVSLGAFVTGNGNRTSLQAGMSLAQIGEFSFIIAALGMKLNATGSVLYPVAVTVSAITTLTTPTLVRISSKAANKLDHLLPERLQTFSTLYASWIDQLRRARATPATGVRRLVGLLVVDAVGLTVVIIAASIFFDTARKRIEEFLGIDANWSRMVVLLAGAVVVVPLLVGVVQVARRLGTNLAERALPHGAMGKLDLSATPRRALVVTLQLGIVALVGVPFVTLTQPFVPGVSGAIVLATLAVVLGVLFWRRANDLQGHVRAGAHVLVEALAMQAHQSLPAIEATYNAPSSSTTTTTSSSSSSPPPAPPSPSSEMPLALGLGEPGTVTLQTGSPAIGKTLSSLDVRGRTGATVLAILRDNLGHDPTPTEVLHVGDVLALIGNADAIASARSLLSPPPPPGVAGEDDDDEHEAEAT